MKRIMNKSIKDEKGQALILAMILMLVGGLIIVPLLGFMSTGLIVGRVFEDKMAQVYAADGGIEDGLWKIINDQIPATQPYSLGTVNDKNVAVEIESVWLLEGMEDDKNGTMPHSELVATGRITDVPSGLYEVEITYDGSKGVVSVKRIGVWLPIGFSYAGPSSGITTDDPVTGSVRGGTSLIWDLTPNEMFPTGTVTTRTQSFYITPVGQDPVGDFSWVRTTRSDIYLSWDADFTTYTVTAIATSASGKQTEVVAHVAREIGAVPYSVGIITWEIS